MKKVTSKFPFIKAYFFSFLLFCSMLAAENAFSRKNWNANNYLKVSYDNINNAIILRFEYFDYNFGPALENGYLEYCDFEYSQDGTTYYKLMRASTRDQHKADWSWINFSNKLNGAKMSFINDNRMPENGTMWNDSLDVRVETNHPNRGTKAWATVKWNMDETYHDINFIRVKGKWHVNGIYVGDKIDAVKNTYTLLYPEIELKKGTSSKNVLTDEMMVKKDADALVVTGAKLGEKIKVYNMSGVELKSVVANNDIVKINLAADRIYLVRVGEKCKKLAL